MQGLLDECSKTKGQNGMSPKEALERLSEFRAVRSKEVASHRKLVVAINGLMKKQENSQVQGLKAQAGQEQVAPIEIMSYIKNRILPEKGGVINMGKDFVKAYEAVPMEPACIGCSEWSNRLIAVPTLQGLQKWLFKGLEAGVLHTYCTLDKPQHLKPITDALHELSNLRVGELAPRLTSPTHEAWLKPMFAFSLMHVEPGYTNTGFGAYGAAQAIFIIKGEIMILGIHSQDLDSMSYTAKLQEMSTLSEEQLGKSIDSKHAFICKAPAGHLLFLPPQFIVRAEAVKQSLLLKWPIALEEASCLTTILSNCTHIASSFPSLATGHFQSWMALLQERIPTMAT